MSELICVDKKYEIADFNRDLEYFLSYLRMKGRRPATVGTYGRALKSVFRTMTDNGMDLDIRRMTGDDIVSLRECLNVCENSKKLYLLVLGRMIEVLYQRNPYKDADILWNRQTPRRLFIRPDDFRVMMGIADERERVALMLGAYMGLRRKEICDVRLSDISGNRLTVRGKGHGPYGKVETLTIPRPVLCAMNEYMASRPVTNCDYLLLSRDDPGRGMSVESLARIVRRLSKQSHVSMTCHSLRRLFATTLFECGIDLNTIRTLTRHEDVSTLVNCYIDVNPVRKDNALEMLCNALA